MKKAAWTRTKNNYSVPSSLAPSYFPNRKQTMWLIFYQGTRYILQRSIFHKGEFSLKAKKKFPKQLNLNRYFDDTMNTIHYFETLTTQCYIFLLTFFTVNLTIRIYNPWRRGLCLAHWSVVNWMNEFLIVTNQCMVTFHNSLVIKIIKLITP